MEEAIATEQARKRTRPTAATVAVAQQLAGTLFGIAPVESSKTLDSYDDANFLVCGPRGSEPSRPYILKIHNGCDSELSRWPFIEAMNGVMQHLATRGILSNLPVAAPDGRYIIDTAIEGGSFAVRLLTFVPGKLMSDVGHSPGLLRDFGRSANSTFFLIKTYIIHTPGSLPAWTKLWLGSIFLPSTDFTYGTIYHPAHNSWVTNPISYPGMLRTCIFSPSLFGTFKATSDELSYRQCVST